MKKLYIILISCLLLSGCAKASTITNNEVVAGVDTTNITMVNNVSYYFARVTPNVDQQLIKVIDSSKNTLDIAIYSLTKKSIVDAIVSARTRGVNVEIITDKIESNSKSEKAELKILKDDNIPIKINSHSGLMHLKMTVTDDTVTTGSYNYTQAATNENDEVLVIIKDSSTANQWKTEFENMWSDTKNYKDY